MVEFFFAPTALPIPGGGLWRRGRIGRIGRITYDVPQEHKLIAEANLVKLEKLTPPPSEKVNK